MADEHSISNNPIFQNCEYPFSELFALLPKLQRQISGNTVTYDTDTDILRAVYQHADNATYQLLDSIQSLGTLLATAADNEDMGLAATNICSIGWLFRAIGNMLGSCYLLQADVGAELSRRDAGNLN